MRMLWIGLAASLVSPMALAQTTIYKHTDDSGRVTYSNRPMKGAMILELDPITTVPVLAKAAGAPEKAASATQMASDRLTVKPSVAVVTPKGLANSIASVDRETQKGRDDVRRRILETELSQEEKTLAEARKSLLQEQQNPTLIAAVRVAQQAAEPTLAQQAEMRAAIDKASGRIRGLQAIVVEHEKNIEALKKELGALKP